MLQDLFPNDGARLIVVYTDVHPHGVARKEVFNQLGPFDEAYGAGIEVIFAAHVVSFIKLFIALVVLPFATVSRSLPTVMSVRIIAADSKYI